MASARTRYCPALRQDGTVKVALPPLRKSLSEPHWRGEAVRPSCQTLNHFRPVTSVWVASGMAALRVVWVEYALSICRGAYM